LADTDSKVARAYGAVTEDRKVPYRHTIYIGKDGKVLAIDKEVKLKTAGADIAKKLGELKVDKKKEG
jgi:peroxiredoxin Q/BCP